MKKGLFVFIFFLLVCFSLGVSANLLDNYNDFVNNVKDKFFENGKGNLGAITGYDVFDEPFLGEGGNPFLTNLLGTEIPSTSELPDVATSPTDILQIPTNVVTSNKCKLKRLWWEKSKISSEEDHVRLHLETVRPWDPSCENVWIGLFEKDYGKNRIFYVPTAADKRFEKIKSNEVVVTIYFPATSLEELGNIWEKNNLEFYGIAYWNQDNVVISDFLTVLSKKIIPAVTPAQPGTITPTTPKPQDPSENCKVLNTHWSKESAVVGGTVELIAKTENCESESVLFEIFEKDALYDDIIAPLAPSNVRKVDDKIIGTWVVVDNRNGKLEFEGKNLEYYFVVEDSNSREKSDLLRVDLQSQELIVGSGDSFVMNSLTLTNKDNVLLTDYPIYFGRLFKKTEVPQGFVPQVLIDGVPIVTQVDVKNRWPDGSLKFALISFVLESLDVDETRTVSFENMDEVMYQSTIGNTPLSASDILSTFPDLEAVMEVSNPAGTHIVSARQMLQDNAIEQYWTAGPLRTTVILRGDFINRTYDFGWKQPGTKIVNPVCSSCTIIEVEDASWVNVNQILNLRDELVSVQSVNTAITPHRITVIRNQPGGLPPTSTVADGNYITATTWQQLSLPQDDKYRALSPSYEISVWQTINKAEVRFVLENTNTETLQDVFYDVDLKLGLTNVATVLSETNVVHHIASRWMRDFWLAGPPGKVEIDHNRDYLAETGVVDKYDNAVSVPESAIAEVYNDWQNAEKGLFKLGLYQYGAMGSAASRAELSQITRWDAMWLNSMDYRMEEVVLSQAELGASWPTHYREGDPTKNFYRDPVTGATGPTFISAVGKVISNTARPCIVLPFFTFATTSSCDKIEPVSRYSKGIGSLLYNNEYGGWQTGIGHYYNLNTEYAYKGRFWDLEEMLFWASYGRVSDSYSRGPDPAAQGGIGGAIMNPYGVRYQFKRLNNLLYASTFAVDGKPENDWLDLSVQDAIVAWMGMHRIALSEEPSIPSNPWTNMMWDFGKEKYSTYTYFGNPPHPSPLNFWLYGNSQLCWTNGFFGLVPFASGGTATICNSPWMYALGVNALGKADDLGYPVGKLLEYMAGYYAWHFNTPGFSPLFLGAYRQGSVGAGNVPFNDPLQVMNAFQPTYQNSPCIQQGGSNCGGPTYSSDGYFSLHLAATARLYDYVPEAYNWWRNEGIATFNTDIYDKDPRYALAPRSLVNPPPLAVCGNNQCEVGEDCVSCQSDCPCANGQQCQAGVCVTPGTPGGTCPAGSSCYTGPSGTQSVGVCQAGTTTCQGNTASCQGEITPQQEDCNDLLDNDCDAVVNNGCFNIYQLPYTIDLSSSYLAEEDTLTVTISADPLELGHWVYGFIGTPLAQPVNINGVGWYLDTQQPIYMMYSRKQQNSVESVDYTMPTLYTPSLTIGVQAIVVGTPNTPLPVITKNMQSDIKDQGGNPVGLTGTTGSAITDVTGRQVAGLSSGVTDLGYQEITVVANPPTAGGTGQPPPSTGGSPGSSPSGSSSPGNTYYFGSQNNPPLPTPALNDSNMTNDGDDVTPPVVEGFPIIENALNEEKTIIVDEDIGREELSLPTLLKVLIVVLIIVVAVYFKFFHGNGKKSLK